MELLSLNKISKIIASLDMTKGRLGTAEEKIQELEDITIQIIQTKA